jgi:TonB-dependent receptor
VNDTIRRYSQDSFYYTAPTIAGQRTPWATSPSFSFENAIWSDVFLEAIRLGYPAPIGLGEDFAKQYGGKDLVTNEVNWVIQEFSDDVDYRGEMDIGARYAMAEAPLLPWLTLVGGVRLEETRMETDVDAADGNDGEARVLDVRVNPETPGFMSANAYNQGNPGAGMTLDGLANASLDQTDVLPALGLILDVADDLKLRANWSRTIGRPTFKEITPVAQQDHLNGAQFAGNPNLKISELQNYDLRLEWIPGTGQLLSASGFYKDIDAPIDYAQRPAAGSTPYIIPFNFESGEVRGLELELRQNLGIVADWFRDFSVGASYTFLDASVTVPERDRRKVHELLELKGKNPDDYELDERPMKDQPEFILNLYLMYDNEDTGTSVGLFFNRKGETLLAGEDANGDDYIGNRVALSRVSLDLTVKQKLWDGWELSFGATNLLNPEIEEVWQSEFVAEEAVASSYKEGITYGVSLTAEW